MHELQSQEGSPALKRFSVAALMMYSITDCRIRQVSWRETTELVLSRVLLSDGAAVTRPFPGGSFGRILARVGLYSGAVSHHFEHLWQALDLLGRPIEDAHAYPEAMVHFCHRCRFGGGCDRDN